MSKDKNGKKLEKGDQVVFLATVTDCGPSGNYDMVTLTSVHGRNPDGLAVVIPSIEAAVLEKVAHPKTAKGHAAAPEEDEAEATSKKAK